METVVTDASPATPRKTFRQRVDGLMDHILAKLDMGSTARHENAYLKTGNLLGAAGKLIDVFEANRGSDTISAEAAVVSVESGQWSQTETLQRLAGEQGVVCQISDDGRNTTVDLTGANREAVGKFINSVINQAVTELKSTDTLESA